MREESLGLSQFTTGLCPLTSAHAAQKQRHTEELTLIPAEQGSGSTYLTLRDTPCGTPMLTAAPKTLCREIFLSAPYSTIVPKKPALGGRAQLQARFPPALPSTQELLGTELCLPPVPHPSPMGANARMGQSGNITGVMTIHRCPPQRWVTSLPAKLRLT